MEDMIRDVGEDSFHQTHVYDSLKDDSRLSAVLRLFNIKARNGWTDRSFTEMLELLHQLLSKVTLLTSHY